MLCPGDLVLVAVSGGPDSVALLAALRLLAAELDVTLLAAHLNHCLRPEADEEERFVMELCADLAAPLTVEKADVREMKLAAGRSMEDMAREVRYEFLERTARRLGADRIALGHHRRDQAETVLLNLLRGSGSEGLKGMTPVRDRRYIRPLIDAEPEEIKAFLARRRLTYREDPSNNDTAILRNRVRHELLPLLKERYSPNIEQTLVRTAAVLNRENDYLREQVRRALAAWEITAAPSGIVLEVEKLRELHPGLVSRIIKHLLEDFAPDGKGIFFPHVQAVMELISSPRRSGCLHLPFRLEVRREYERLLIRRRGDEAPMGEFSYPATVPGKVQIGETGDILEFKLADGTFTDGEDFFLRIQGAGREGEQNQTGAGGGMAMAVQARLDFDAVAGLLQVRNIRAGDRIRPLGMAGTKKVQEIFIDRKLPRTERKRLPLLVAGERILWIPGVCIAAEAKITAKTKRILQAGYRRAEEKSVEITTRLL